MAKSGLLPVSANKVLLEHSHTHSSALQVLSHFNSRVEHLQRLHARRHKEDNEEKEGLICQK